MTPNSGDNHLHTEDETSVLLGKNVLAHTDTENEEAPRQPAGFKEKYMNRFFLIEAFAWLNYLIGILNILFNAVIYLQIYEPQFYQKLERQCHDQMPMVIFLDNFLTISTIIFFAYILRYLKQVDS